MVQQPGCNVAQLVAERRPQTLLRVKHLDIRMHTLVESREQEEEEELGREEGERQGHGEKE